MRNAQNEKVQNALSTLPDSPGVYLFRDDEGTIIYIGKALSLKESRQILLDGNFSTRKTKTGGLDAESCRRKYHRHQLEKGSVASGG